MPDAPPEYERIVDREIEPFEIEDPEDGQSSRFSHVKTRFIMPVRYFVVDPVVRWYQAFCGLVETLVSKVMSPILAWRLFSLGIVTFIFIYCINLYGAGSGKPTTFTEHREFAKRLDEFVDRGNLRHTAEYFASIPHLSGTIGDRVTAEYISEAFTSFGISEVEINRKEVFLTHRNQSRLVLLDGEQVVAEANFLEGSISDDKAQVQPQPHMSLELGGDVRGRIIYGNYGSLEDMLRLKAMPDLDIANKIVFVKYGKGDPSIAAARIAEMGAAAVIFFSEKHPVAAPWPDGPDYGEESVQNACMGIPYIWPGDIFSPGWSSSSPIRVADVSTARSIVHIPVGSLSWKEVGPFLKAMEGYGEDVTENWGNNGYPKEVERWYTGNDSSPEVHLTLDVEMEDRHAIHNVLARISGAQHDIDSQIVFIGAKMDSFCFGGVGLSGLSTLLQVARVMGRLHLEHNWKPARSIIFGAWDGTTQNFAGATEWMELVAPRAVEAGIIYIDLDKGVTGSESLVADGNPSIDLRGLFGFSEETRQINPLFSNLDVFSSHVGIPSVSLGVAGQAPVYPKDSCFEALEWQEKFGDADFSGHETLAKAASHLLYEFANHPILPFNLTYYAENVKTYTDDLRDYADTVLGPKRAAHLSEEFGSMDELLNQIKKGGQKFDDFAHRWGEAMADPGAKESAPLTRLRETWNRRVMEFHKLLLSHSGIGTRNWFKNVIIGPQFDDDVSDIYSGTFPGIRDAITSKGLPMIRLAMGVTLGHLNEAADSLMDVPDWI